MRQIVGYLAHHARHHVSGRLHLLLAVLLAAAFVYNYTTAFKHQVMNAHTGQWVEPLLYVLYYAVPYFGTLLIQRWLTGRSLPRSRLFWWLAIAGGRDPGLQPLDRQCHRPPSSTTLTWPP